MSIDVLQERIRKLKCPIMVGLDPYLPILPRHIVRDAFDEYGQTLRGAAEQGVRRKLGDIEKLPKRAVTQDGGFGQILKDRDDPPLLLQPGDERLGLIRHLGKFCRLLLVYPVKDLLGTKTRLPQLFHKGCKLFDRK